MRYLLDRLNEPGTMRSLIWVLMSLAGFSVTDQAVAQYALAATTLLGIISAFMPEPSGKSAAKVENAVQTARDLATLAVATTSEARQATAQAAQVVESTKSLAESVAAGAITPMGRAQ